MLVVLVVVVVVEVVVVGTVVVVVLLVVVLVDVDVVVVVVDVVVLVLVVVVVGVVLVVLVEVLVDVVVEVLVVLVDVEVVVLVVVDVVVVVLVDVVVVGTCLSPNLTSVNSAAKTLAVWGFCVVTCQPVGTFSFTLYAPSSMHPDMNRPLLSVVAVKFTGPVVLNANPGNGCSPCSQMPFPLVSWNLKIFRNPQNWHCSLPPFPPSHSSPC